MGLNVKILNITYENTYSLRYKSGDYPYPENNNSTFTLYGTGLTDSSITLTGLSFDTQYWVKMTDDVTGRYIIKNIYTHDSKSFPCYDTICFDIEVECLSGVTTPSVTPSITPTPTSSITPTPTPSITPTSSITPTLTPSITPTPTPSSTGSCCVQYQVELLGLSGATVGNVQYTNCVTLNVLSEEVLKNVPETICSCSYPIALDPLMDLDIVNLGPCFGVFAETPTPTPTPSITPSTLT
jgi:hypothetical protein